MAQAKFYTYVHRRADTGEVFYVGKGSGARLNATQDRGVFWHRVVKKYGMYAEKVAHFFDEKDAFDHECFLIAQYRQQGIRLVNATAGGEGPSGAKRSDETRRRMSEAMTGLKHKSPSDDARARMSASRMGRKNSPEAIAKTAAAHRGMKRSEETLARMSAALKGLNVGRIVSEETRAKISAVHTGRKNSPEAKERMRIAALSRSPETKETYRLAAIAREAKKKEQRLALMPA